MILMAVISNPFPFLAPHSSHVFSGCSNYTEVSCVVIVLCLFNQNDGEMTACLSGSPETSGLASVKTVCFLLHRTNCSFVGEVLDRHGVMEQRPP